MNPAGHLSYCPSFILPPSLIFLPVLNPQSLNAAELSNIGGHKGEIMRSSSGSNEKVVWAYRSTSALQGGANTGVVL